MNKRNSLSVWWLAIRPKTLSISVTPVLLGSALAWHDLNSFSLLSFFIILLSALFIQIGTNLYNDAADFEKGADTDERLGPRRAAQHGWLNARQIKTGAFVSFLLSFFAGCYLVWLGGLAIVILGLVSITCGYAYTAGPKPIAYSPLGEIFVLVFFGFAAVGGTYYLHSHTLNLSVLLLASSIGSMAAAILLVNNYRDLDSDRKVNKLTLVHYIGRSTARLLYAGLILYPYLLLFIFIPDYTWRIVLPVLSLPIAIRLIRDFFHLEISAKLNQVLARTAQLQLIFTVLLALVLIFQV